MSWAFERDVFDFRHDPAEAKRLLDEAGFRDPDGDGPLPRLRADAQDLDLGDLPAAGGGDPAGPRARRHRRRRAVERVRRRCFADVVRGNFQLYTLQCCRRHRSGHAAPGLSLGAGAAGRPQPRPLRERRGRSADRRGRRVAGRRRAQARSTARAQRLIARDVPYISLWYKTNVAVFQPDIEGVALSPIADFTFLKDVRRGCRRRSR